MIRLAHPRPIANDISTGSAVYAGLTIVTDGQTDRQTDHATLSVTVGRIYLCSAAMQLCRRSWLMIFLRTLC